MKLYLDEMISPPVATSLRRRGHDVVCAVERGALGVSDARQLALAIRERRALGTYDVRDFSLLAKAAGTAGHDHWGIVFVSAGKLPPAAIGKLVDALDAFLETAEGAPEMKNRTVFLGAP